MIDLDELERLARNATPGSWFGREASTLNGTTLLVGKNGAQVIAHFFNPAIGGTAKGNIDFIGAANPAVVLGLIRMVRERETDRFFADAPDPRDEQIAALQAENAELRRGNEVLLAQAEALHKAGDALDLLPGATLTTAVVAGIQQLRNPTPEMLLAMTRAFAEHFSPGITGSGATYDNISAALALKMYRAAIDAARQ